MGYNSRGIVATKYGSQEFLVFASDMGFPEEAVLSITVDIWEPCSLRHLVSCGHFVLSFFLSFPPFIVV
jgi:hypothetical protein